MADHCRSCGAAIRWVRTTAGKLMPLDAEPNPDGNVELADEGRAVVLGDEPSLFVGERWMPHFATCPHGQEWSTKSRGPGSSGFGTSDEAAKPANPQVTAAQAKAEAVDEVEEHADPLWLAAALDAVRHVAGESSYFTTDQVWARLEDTAPQAATHERRAMGAVMRWAARQGIVARTDTTRPSERPQCHGRDVRIWRSLLDQPTEAAP